MVTLRKTMLVAIACWMVLLLLAGCGQGGARDTREQTITITDAAGRQVKVPYPAKRVVCLSSDAGEVICALKGEKQVAAVSSTLKRYPIVKERFADTPEVGNFSQPNVEKIIEVRPDVVLGYASSIENKVAEKIEAAGIPFVVLPCNDMPTFVQDVHNLGRILGKEENAQKFVAFIESNFKKITEVTGKIPADKRPRVYVEGFSPLSTYGQKSPSAQIIELAGGKNIAASEAVPSPKVTSEWVIAQNPDVIVKVVTSDKTQKDIMQKERDALISRPGFSKIAAVKNGRVHVIGWKVYTGARAVVGAAYLARWLHPDQFADIDPEAIHRELMEKFYGTNLEGTWVYP